MRSCIFILLIALGGVHAFATTWNEPWHDEVVRMADLFVRVQIIDNNSTRATAKVTKLLAGVELGNTITIQNYSKLQLGSYSASDELALPFKAGNEYYLLVKKDPKTGSYQLPTPTSGWAWIENGNVYATYRHSYHKALVPVDIYEKTTTAIFNTAKNKLVDQSIAAFVTEQLASAPAALSDDMSSADSKRFFLQHVALETFFHTGVGADLKSLKPFLEFKDFHTQISAARAIGRIKSAEAQTVLMDFIEGKGVGFAKVMCVWALRDQNARQFEARLRLFSQKGRDEETGFGGSIMDPRVGTAFPESVKDAVNTLLAEWKRTRNASNLRT